MSKEQRVLEVMMSDPRGYCDLWYYDLRTQVLHTVCAKAVTRGMFMTQTDYWLPLEHWHLTEQEAHSYLENPEESVTFFYETVNGTKAYSVTLDFALAFDEHLDTERRFPHQIRESVKEWIRLQKRAYPNGR